MKQKKHLALILATFALASSVHANPIRRLFDKFSSVNKEAKNECAKMDNDEVAALCVEEVCGSASKNPVIIDASNVDQFNTDETKKKIDDLETSIRKRAEEVDKYARLVVEKQNELKKLTDPEQISDQDAEKILENITNRLRKKHKIVQKLVSSKNGEIKLFVPITSPYHKIYKNVISKINIKENILFANNVYFSPGYDVEYQIYQDRASKFKEELKKKNLTTEYNFEEAQRSLQERGPSSAMIYYNLMTEAAKTAGIKLENPVCDQECKQHLIQFLKTAPYLDPNATIAKERKRFNLEDTIAECRAAEALSNIQAKNADEIKKEWPKLIERLKNNTSLKLSDHSKGLILDKIKNNLNVQYNVSPSTPKVDPFAESLTAIHLNKMESLSDFYDVATDEVTLKYATKSPRCAKIDKVAIINDFQLYLPTVDKGALVVSPFSCEHVHLGKEIMAHELGHAVSNFIAFSPNMSTETRENSKNLRECSRKEKRTTKFPALVARHEGDKWTTEEDTADLFSYAVSDDKENFIGCALVIPNGKAYQALKMRKGFADTHSSGIQRLMVELQYKNPDLITEACDEVIERSKSRITNKCL